jgi:transposase InsO family protein
MACGRMVRSTMLERISTQPSRAATSGLPIAHIAPELSLNETVLRRWIATYPAEGMAPQQRSEGQAAESSLADLAAENAGLRRELMRRAGLQGTAALPRRVRTTDSLDAYPIAPNRLDQTFAASRPNEVWLADLTYVPIGGGWLFLAATRRPAGWPYERCARLSRPGSRSTGSGWRSSDSGRRPASSLTRIAAATMLPTPTARSLPQRRSRRP